MPKSGASSPPWPWTRKNGRKYVCSATFFRYVLCVLYHTQTLTMLSFTSACRWHLAGVFRRHNSNSSKCSPMSQKITRGMGKGLNQGLLCPVCPSPHRWDGQAWWILSALGWVWCPHHGNGYVSYWTLTRALMTAMQCSTPKRKWDIFEELVKEPHYQS